MDGFGSGWVMWAVLSALFAAATAISAKVGLRDVDSDAAMFVRTCVVLALTAGILFSAGKARAIAAFSPKTWLFLILSGCATGLSWLCYFRALALGDAARVAPLDKLSVVFVALLGCLLLGERLTPINWLGVGLIAAGAVAAAWR